MSSELRAAVPPMIPCIATSPVPEVISRSVEPLIVLLIVTLPAVAPVFKVTAPVEITSGSEMVIVPPAP